MIINTYSVLQKTVRVCSMFYPYEGYRSVTPLDAARVNRTIFHIFHIFQNLFPNFGMRSLPIFCPLLNFQILETLPAFPVFPVFPVFLGKEKEEK